METVGNTATLLLLAPIIASQTSGAYCREVFAEDTHSKTKLLWAYPLNAIVNLVGVVLQPLVSLVALLAAGIFKLISCCSEEEVSLKADKYCQKALERAAEIFDLYILLVRVIYPAFQLSAIDEKFA